MIKNIVLSPNLLTSVENIVIRMLCDLQAEEGNYEEILPIFYLNILRQYTFDIEKCRIVLLKIKARIEEEKFFDEWGCYEHETFFDDADIELLMQLSELHLKRYNSDIYDIEDQKHIQNIIHRLKAYK